MNGLRGGVTGPPRWQAFGVPRRKLGPAARSAAVGVCLAVGVGAAAAGCGGGSSARRAAQPWQLVAAAPDKTTAAGTARFAISAATHVLGQAVNFSGSGVFDFTNKTGRVSFALPANLGGQSVDEIVTPETVYLKVPPLTPAGKYAAVKLTDLTGGAGSPLAQLGNTDPTTALETLLGVSHDVRKVGTATVRGTSTTHYTGNIDVSKAIDSVPTTLKSKVQQAFGQVKSLPFDAYIDDQGRLRRFVQHLSLPASTTTGGQPVTADSTFDLYDFGTTVHVIPPPANQTVDGATLFSRLSRS